MVSMVFLVYHCLVLKEKKMLFVLDICIALEETSRENRPEVFCKKGVLKNFAKFTEKHLCQSLFFNKGVRPAVPESLFK